MADPTPTKNAIQATTLSEAQGRRWIAQLLTGRAQSGGQRGRFTALHEAIRERDKAFHAENPPKFAPPFDQMQTFQSDSLRQTHQELMVRMTEHPVRVKVNPPKDTQAQRDAAEGVAVWLETGLELIEEGQGTTIMGMLADSQIRHCYGVLHWYKRKDVYPDYPDPYTIDELPGDKTEAANYRPTTPEDKIEAKYRETEASVKQRDQIARAQAGFTWCIEVPRPDTFAFVPDRFAKNKMAVAVTLESISRLDYDQGLRSEGWALSVNEINSKLLVVEEQPRPERGDPSSNDAAWGQLMRLARLWTRDECYEFGAYEQGEFTLLRSWPHDYGMVPFALAPATELNDPDPLYRYQPFLMGQYRTKPDYDYERSLGRILAEQTAIPRYWVELAPGQYWLDAHGNKIVLSEDALSAEALPPGAKLVKADLTVDPAFIAFLQMSGDDLTKATPPTGFVDATATTAPHTLSMQQTQANAPLADLKVKAARALRTCFRNIIEVESKGTEDLVCYAKVKGTTLVPGTLVSVSAKDIPGLDVDVTVNPNSGAQEVSIAELGREWLKDPTVPFTAREWLSMRGVENPDATIEAWMTENAEFKMAQVVLDRELARRYGDVFVLSQGGTVVNAQGAATDSATVLGTQGIRPAPPPAGPPISPRDRPLAPLTPLAPLQQPATTTMAGTP